MPNYKHIEMFTTKNSKYSDQGKEVAYMIITIKSIQDWGFPGGAVVRNPPANSGDTGSCPGPGRSHMPWSG